MIFIHSSTLVFKSQRFNVETVEYGFDGPDLYKRDIVRHPGAVVVLAINYDGSLLFIKQPRVALGREMLELPAGTRNEDEIPLVCAKRELAEEVGLAASDWISLGEIFPAPGFCDEQQFLFVARGLSESRLPQDAEERISVHSYSKEQVIEMIADGTLQDAKSLALLFRARVLGVW